MYIKLVYRAIAATDPEISDKLYYNVVHITTDSHQARNLLC